jgi:ketosteroid isomerase-like protein
MAEGAAKEVVGQFLKAIKAANGATMMALLADDAVVVLPGSYKVPWSGRWQGKDTIAQCFRLVGEFLDIRGHDVKLMFGEGEHVLVLMYETTLARNTGRVLHQETAWLFRVQRGTIAYWQCFEDTEQIAWVWDDAARAWGAPPPTSAR